MLFQECGDHQHLVTKIHSNEQAKRAALEASPQSQSDHSPLGLVNPETDLAPGLSIAVSPKHQKKWEQGQRGKPSSQSKKKEQEQLFQPEVWRCL